MHGVGQSNWLETTTLPSPKSGPLHPYPTDTLPESYTVAVSFHRLMSKLPIILSWFS